MSKRICAWCGEPMGNGNGAENTETHGICKNCLARYFSETMAHIFSGSVELEAKGEILHGRPKRYSGVRAKAAQ